MKRNCFIILAFVCAAVSCTEENVQKEVLANVSDIVFVCDAESSRIAIGEKNGPGYTCLWEEGDALDVL